ncbi:MAG TPA: DNA-3-methyladenine glycosylase [Gemmatimonadales bacterium]|nr:DNA-3-methyladenine glycosylase [Gemmatimonadales bacterium]
MTSLQRAATLPVRFFARPADAVARDLVGALIVSSIDGQSAMGRIVETEAYLGYDDPASHGYRHRRHAQNEALYGPPGSWYVYRSYGIHWCANLVCQAEGDGSAVLLRAVEPLEGVEVMRGRRRLDEPGLLCAGPGRLCQALGITRLGLDGQMMEQSPVMELARNGWAGAVEATPRVGITKAVGWPLRFAAAGSPWVSRRGISIPRVAARERSRG